MLIKKYYKKIIGNPEIGSIIKIKDGTYTFTGSIRFYQFWGLSGVYYMKPFIRITAILSSVYGVEEFEGIIFNKNIITNKNNYNIEFIDDYLPC